MPNYVINRVDMRNVKNLDIYNEEGELDFNKIIPMPEDLDIDSFSEDVLVRNVIRSASNILQPNYIISALIPSDNSQTYENNGNELMEYLDEYKEMDERLVSNLEKANKDAFDLGIKYIQNNKKYGYPTWYEWRIANWGTKWNAVHYSEISDDSICFDTAWYAPYPIIKQLSKDNPYDEIVLTSTSEGCNFDIVENHFLDGDLIEKIDYGELIWKSDYETEMRNREHLKRWQNIQGYYNQDEIEDLIIEVRLENPIQLIEEIK